MLRRICCSIGAAALFAVIPTLVVAQETSERRITVLTVEVEMERSVDRTPFPDTLERHPNLMDGGGYLLEPPNEDGVWRARAYMFMPATIVVMEGETVVLEFFGINGNSHPTTIEAFGQEFEVRRGELTEVTFVADRPGIYEIVCTTHQPSMTATLVVLAQD